MAHHDDNLIIDTPGAPIMGATAVPGTLKMVRVDADGRLITVPSSVVAGALNLEIFEDTNFTSTITLDFNTVLGQNASYYEIINDGSLAAESFTFAVSEDGAAFGGEATLLIGESFVDTNTDVDSLRITHTGNDSAYRVRFR